MRNTGAWSRMILCFGGTHILGRRLDRDDIALEASFSSHGATTNAVSLTDVVDMGAWGAGNCSYPGMLLADPSKPMRTFSQFEIPFLSHSSNSGVIANFNLLLGERHTMTTSKFYEFATGLGARFAGNDAWNQGVDGAWISDTFVADLVGHTVLTPFLVEDGPELVLDFTGQGSPTSPLQVLLQRAVLAATQEVLRCKAFFRKSSTLELVRIEVHGASSTHTVSPTDHTWALAKVVLTSFAGQFLVFLHSAVHLFGASTTTAFSLSLPLEAPLAKVVDPFTVSTLQQLLAVMLLIDNDHDAVWSGSVWDSNITEVTSVTVAIARFFLEAPLYEILGCQGESVVCQAPWWAGGAPSFVQPINEFARGVAEDVNDPQLLHSLSQELRKVGLTTNNHLITGTDGLAKFLAKVVFMQGVYHSSFFASREFLTLLGLPHTSKLYPFFSDSSVRLTLADAIDQAYPSPTPHMVAWAQLTFAASAGVPGVVELGTGPFGDVQESTNHLIVAFQKSLASVRQGVQEVFPPRAQHRFFPLYYFPESARKPWGYSLTQTTYV